MAVPTKTAQTYSAKTLREDLSDIVERISPTETPFMTAIGKGTATNTYHEWTTVELAAATDANAVIEGDDAANDDVNEGVRLGNYTQLSDKVVQISSSRDAGDEAGNLNKMATQVAMKVAELKRDMEKQMLSNKAASAGSAGSPRVSASFASFLQSNVSRGTGGANPTLSGVTSGYPNAAGVDGAQRTLTEDLLKDVIAKAWDAGGNPNRIFVGSFNKQAISGFTGNATRFKEAEDKKLVAAIDVYVSDFGELQVVPSRFQRGRDLFVVDPEKASVDYFQTMKQTELAKTGHSDRRMVSVEYTLKVHNEKAHGAVFDLATN